MFSTPTPMNIAIHESLNEEHTKLKTGTCVSKDGNEYKCAIKSMDSDIDFFAIIILIIFMVIAYFVLPRFTSKFIDIFK